MTPAILTSIIIFLSVLLAIISYGFYKLMKLNITSEQASIALYEELRVFSNHLEQVYNRDTFYGDEVLQNLLDHSRDIQKYVKDFVNESSLPENDYIQDEETFYDTETNSQEKA